MNNAQSHYPAELQGTTAPYQLTKLAPRRSPTVFHYQISANLRRQHSNPPIWNDAHYHDFRVTLHLRAVRGVCSMYGVDMIEQENLLKFFCDALPDVVNDHPLCGGGTTEDLCQYFATMQFDPHIDLVQVDVAETGDRITSLRLNSEWN